MLIMFRAKNYASFKEDVILDLRKTNYREHMNHVLNISDFDLLKTVAIYGANASGKSNLISAISVFQEIVQEHFFDIDKKTEEDESKQKKVFRAKSFALSNEIDNEIEFEIVFYNKKLYQYGFSIEKDIVKKEWLLVENEIVYERDEQRIVPGDMYSDALMNYSKYREDRLYISVLDYFSVEEKIVNLMSSFKDFFIKKLIVFFEIILEATIKGSISGIRLYNKIENDEIFRKKVAEYLMKIDTGIIDLVVYESEITNLRNNEDRSRKIIKTVHRVFDNNNKCVGTCELNLSDESSGTLRFLSFIQDILSIFENGGVFIVDELSSRLHPLLTKFIVDLFQTEDNNNTQLIFTTHDTTLMNKNQFRRDEIVLVDKGENGVSRIYSLSDLDIRKDASYEKDYFNGKYGAIPIIKSYGILENCE